MISLPWVVYLLCFDRPVDGLRHYVGITTTNRLQHRMIEHQNGRGARLTTLAHQLEIPFALTALWPCASPAIEHVIAGTPFLSSQCSRCCNGDYWVQYATRKKRPSPRARPLILDWTILQPKVPKRTESPERREAPPKPAAPPLPVGNS
jgi:hypothetical protein